MEVGQRRQRDRDEGQASLFDVLGGGDAAPVAVAPTAVGPGVPEWPQEEMLAFEKEVLGFYLSGHPLERYRDVARRIERADVGRARRPARRRARAAARADERGDARTRPRAAIGWRSSRSSWWTAPCRSPSSPSPTEAARARLRHRGPVLVRGRTDDSDKGRVVLAEEIKPLEDAMRPAAGTAAARMHGGAAAPHVSRAGCASRATRSIAAARVASGAACCEEHEGRTPLFLHVLLPEQEVVVRVKELLVDPGADLVAKVESLLGPGSILVEYAGRA